MFICVILFFICVIIFYGGVIMADDSLTEDEIKILVVDDDETLIRTVQAILKSYGYTVLAGRTGEEGLELAKKEKPDLILLDVLLPKMKGREVCKKIKEIPELKNIPVIFLTAKDSPEDIEAEMAAGAVGHLTKPVYANVLISTLRRILKS